MQYDAVLTLLGMFEGKSVSDDSLARQLLRTVAIIIHGFKLRNDLPLLEANPDTLRTIHRFSDDEMRDEASAWTTRPLKRKSTKGG